MIHFGVKESQRLVTLIAEMEMTKCISRVAHSSDRKMKVVSRAKPVDVVVITVYMTICIDQNEKIEKEYD